MTLPDRNEVMELLQSGGLTGAETEVLSDYLAQDDMTVVDGIHSGDEDWDAMAADAAELNPYAYLIHRVSTILQNHR